MLVLLFVFTIVEYTIRLVHGKYGYEGQLEVFLKNVWSSVCLSGMDLATVSGICYVLGWEYGAKNVSLCICIMYIFKGLFIDQHLFYRQTRLRKSEF